MTNNHSKEVLKTLRSRALNDIRQGNKQTHSFRVDYSEINEDFVGIFEVHRPSIMEQMQMGVVKTQLLGGVTDVDVFTDNIAIMISTLDTILDKSPSWFNPWDDQLSYEILESVYTEYQEWYSNFRKKPTESGVRRDSEDGRSDSTLEANEGVQGTTD